MIDLGDATLLPGFIDAHTHLTYPYERDYRVEELNALKKTIPERTLDAVDIVRRTLMAGFTTVRDVGAGDFIDVGLRNAIEAGKIPGPRMLVAVNSIGATGGHCDSARASRHGFGSETGVADGVANGPDEVRAAVRFNIKYGADVIKTCATGGVLSLTDDVDTPQIDAGRTGRPGGRGARAAPQDRRACPRRDGRQARIRAGIDSIEHGTFPGRRSAGDDESPRHLLCADADGRGGLKDATDGYLPPMVAAKARQAIAALDVTVARPLPAESR